MAGREHLRFLGRAAANPVLVGAVLPSSRALARAIAAQTDPAREGPVLELGPGTGAVTTALIARGYAPGRITAIERDEEFADLIEARWPHLHLIRANALALSDLAGETRFAHVVSGLPLLNLPAWMRERLVFDALSLLLPGGSLIQFSYGFHPPVEPPEVQIARAAQVWLNLPPARVWVYRAAD
ncbi:MAG: methyltransferase domain-containing protein [Alphaproteobacteria bacterium]|nr:methyltransferase domain-containing protein [Alphaproteobacteria bacterium]